MGKKDKKCHYILFTGLPGSGKSSTHKALAEVLRMEGKKVLFRDDAVRAYNKLSLFTGMFWYMPISKLYKVSWFWLTFPPPRDGRYRWSHYRFWRKKYCLWKRMVTSHVIIGKERPDYFIDETIQVDYRLFGREPKMICKIISLYPKSEMYYVISDTALSISVKRVIGREVSYGGDYNELSREWSNSKPWLQQMYKNIIDTAFYLQSNQSPQVKICRLNGELPVDTNVTLLLDVLHDEDARMM